MIIFIVEINHTQIYAITNNRQSAHAAALH